MGFFSGVGSFLNDFTGISSQQNKTYKQQVASMEAQNAYNASMWQKQNEYNSPSAQLARMREAGIDINPTSYALGTGNLSNTATFVGSENGFSGSGSPAGNPISMALGVANGISEIKNRDAMTDNLGVQNENLHAQNANLLVQNDATRIDNEIKRHNLEIARRLGMPVGETPDVWRVIGQKSSEYSRGDIQSFKKFGSDVYNFSKKMSMNPLINPGNWVANKVKKLFK